MRVRWRNADGALTRFSVKEIGRKYLREMKRAAVVFESVGARLVEQEEVSRFLLGSNYWSWRWQLWCVRALAYGFWR